MPGAGPGSRQHTGACLKRAGVGVKRVQAVSPWHRRGDGHTATHEHSRGLSNAHTCREDPHPAALRFPRGAEHLSGPDGFRSLLTQDKS